MRLYDARRIQTYEEQMKWPQAQAVGAIGVAMAEAHMLDNKIVPCRPALDVGFDLASAFGPVMKRVQVKATQSGKRTRNDSTTFHITRTKTGVARAGKYMHTPAQSYAADQIDAFVFVHVERGHFYVMPAAAIDLNRHKIALAPDSPWADAWWVLKTPAGDRG
jgi:hypothetical protein